MATILPEDGMVITRDVSFQPGVYWLPNGVSIGADEVVLEGNGALIVSSNTEGRGVTINRRRNVTVRNLRIVGFYHGIWANACEGLRIERCAIRSTHELPALEVFLDVWRGREEAYGGAIFLSGVSDSEVLDNDVQHQQNGIMLYGCRRVRLRGNNASYNSGAGLLLYESSDNVIEDNTADFCCRAYAPSGDPQRTHVGADAAALVIMCDASRNVVRNNRFRASGDGVFLGGFHKDQIKVPCNDNVFDGNDVSYSPNVGFEATFSQRNVFRHNRADFCNYGFWLGWSSETTVEHNRICGNRTAGVAIEHGHHNLIRDNYLERNSTGVQLWVNDDANRGAGLFRQFFPEGAETHETAILNNQFMHNDSGVHVWTERGANYTGPRCRALRVSGNMFRDNRIGVLFERVRQSAINGNLFEGNLVAAIKLVGCAEVSTEGNRV
ncbi:MAG: NosD domain-containing protein [Anaerolineae bacterium]|nr:right-handed parallel beta-helix repeat-containing protein [Thermoflexales bacterium]MDW8292310.1 NosD domain-containing protein [Anaerolineae bacterium]